MTDKIQPALTAEEWAGREHGPGRSFVGTSEVQLWNDGGLSYGFEYDIDQRHTVAALCLYRQPFGFTREHAAYMAHAARHASAFVLDVLTACQRCGEGGLTNGDTHCGFCAHMVRAEIAARIAALLPPEAING